MGKGKQVNRTTNIEGKNLIARHKDVANTKHASNTNAAVWVLGLMFRPNVGIKGFLPERVRLVTGDCCK